ncbi:MAG: sigma-70 family RNA polymerase sigma factor [Mariniblastus sp.]|nr:sigma-70 family RNA polymerase sigma factor [Mariniblastus sp.]
MHPRQSTKDELEKLYRDHREGLYAYSLSLTRSELIAEDALQNGFLRLVHSQAAWDRLNAHNGNRVAYLFKSVRNAAIDLGRSVKRQNSLSQALFGAYGEFSLIQEPIENALVEERSEILRKAIDRLDDKDQEAIVLKLYGGLTFEQAGEIANVSPKTIAIRYRRTLGKLEEYLKGVL